MISKSKPTIILTRPAGQNDALKTRLEKLDYACFELPLLKIDFFAQEQLLAKLKNLGLFNYIIFTSINAVKAAEVIFGQLNRHFDKDSQLFCIGQGSANALQKLSQAKVIYPETNYSSEGLLETLQSYPLENKSVLIVTGEEGLTILQAGLTQNLAKVSLLTVYKRSQPELDKAVCEQLKNLCTPRLFVLTSAESVKNLHTLLHDKISWNQADMLVLSQRIEETLRNLGYQGKIKKPKISSDDAIVQAILAWHEDEI